MPRDNIDKEFANKYNTTKQTFSTLWKPYDSPYDTNEYAVGLLMDDKIHLHPIHEVVQH
ncbi:hypothetical protein JHK86_002656 [Glycine max]|nr:hypothetical protein JHK86_002656 [Glycine max]